MLSKIAFVRAWLGGFQVFPKYLLRRPRLAGNLGESQEERPREPSPAHGIDANRLVLRGALQDHRTQILDAPSEFRLPAQHFIELLYFLVQRSGAREVQLLTASLALLLKGGTQRSAARFQKLHQVLHLRAVFFLGAARKTRREAPFHFGVHATRKRRVA